MIIAGSAAVPSQNFDRFAVGADLRLTAELPVLGALQISGELISASNLDRAVQPADPVSMGRDIQEVGYYVGVTQELTPYAMIGLRYDHYGPDTDGTEQRGVALVPLDSSYSTVAVAAAARFAPGPLILEYDFDENALGRSPAGIPTTLASNQLERVLDGAAAERLVHRARRHVSPVRAISGQSSAIRAAGRLSPRGTPW